MSKLAQAKKQPEIRSTLAQKVRWIRQQAGWTQEQAAAEMGVARGTFNGWETGREVIPPAKLHKLKNLAHVVLADFKPELIYDEEGYPAPYSETKRFDSLDAYDEANPKGFSGVYPFDMALAKLEGEEFLEREMQRCYLSYLRDCRNGVIAPKTKAAFVRDIGFSTNAAYYAEVSLEASKG